MYARMLEIYTFVWICISYIVMFTVVMWVMMAFRFRGCPLPGSRLLMYAYPFFVNLPIALALDPVTCTHTFREAALRKGYPGAAYFHAGFRPRLAIMVTNAVVFLGAWLALLAAQRTPLQHLTADMYPLYGLALLHTLALFALLPRYANMCKSRQALLETMASRRGSGDRQQWWRCWRAPRLPAAPRGADAGQPEQQLTSRDAEPQQVRKLGGRGYGLLVRPQALGGEVSAW